MSLFQVDLGGPAVFVHVPKTGGTSIRSSVQIGTYRVFDPDPAWSGLPSFGFIREPFDRAVSCWRDFYYLRRMTKLNLHEFLVRYTGARAESKVADPRTIEHHMAPMTHPVHGLQHAQWIGHQVQLQAHFDKICLKLGLKSFHLPHLRDTSTHPMVLRSEFLDNLVRDIYKDDYAFLEGKSFPWERPA